METTNRGSTTPRNPRRRVRRRRGVGAAVAAIGLVIALTAVTFVHGADPASAIVAGQDTAITEVPWQVSLRADGELFCGGSVIGERLVLTAAHCTEGLEPGEITVRAGVTEASDDGGEDRVVTKIFENPGYAEDGIADVAVLVLAEPLRSTDTVQSVGLASPEELDAATTAMVSGWGVSSEDDEDIVEDLQSTTVALLDDPACANLLEPEPHDPNQETCTGGVDATTGTGEDAGSCYGDSGGPLVIHDAAGTPKLAGIVSWGIECGVSPDVYAEVPAFASWIQSITPDTAPVPRDTDTPDESDEWFDPDTDGWEDEFDEFDEWFDPDTDGWDDEWIEFDDGSDHNVNGFILVSL